MRTTAQSIPERPPIGHEVVEMKRLVIRPLSFRQSSNQCPCGVHHKDAAFIMVPLLGYAGGLEASAQPYCKLSAAAP